MNTNSTIRPNSKHIKRYINAKKDKEKGMMENIMPKLCLRLGLIRLFCAMIGLVRLDNGMLCLAQLDFSLLLVLKS